MGGRDDEGLYAFAGKGAKHRERMRLAESRRAQKASSPPPQKERRIPEQPNRTAGENDDPQRIKAIVRRLVRDRNMSAREIASRLRQKGYTLSLVAISYLKSQMREP